MGSQQFAETLTLLHASVCICTWNRSRSLSRTLQSILEAEIPEWLKWEIVVVDNNSTDGTMDVIALYSQKLPITAIFEAKSGLSNARNAAVNVAKGKYLIWTDDDVVVDRQWIAAYMQAFIKYPDAAFFGGPIRAKFEVEPPSWLASGWESVRLPYCHNDLSNEEILLSFDNELLPFGANYAVSRLVQLKYLYDPKLGAGPNSRYHGEETGVMKEILATYKTGYWVPNASVQHINGVDRMNLNYIKKYYIKSGQTEVANYGISGKRKLFGVPLWLWRKAIVTNFDYLCARLIRKPKVWLAKYAIYSVTLGQLYEAKKIKSISRNKRRFDKT